MHQARTKNRQMGKRKWQGIIECDIYKLVILAGPLCQIRNIKLFPTLTPSAMSVAQWVLLLGPEPQWVRQLGKNYTRTGKRFHRISHFLCYII